MRILLLVGFIALFGCSTDQLENEQQRTTWTYVCQTANPFIKKNSQGQYYIGATQVTKAQAEAACKLAENN
jgi:hypothetical protein